MDENNNKIEVEEVVEIKDVKTQKKIFVLFKKYGFFLGLFLIIGVAFIIASQDKVDSFKGTLDYDMDVFYYDYNRIYTTNIDSEPVLLSTNVQNNFDISNGFDVINYSQVSEDQKMFIFFENIDTSTTDYGDVNIGDLCIYEKGKKTTVANNVFLGFALSSDFNEIVFAQGAELSNGEFFYNLCLYNGKEVETIATDVEPYSFNISSDGKAITYFSNPNLETGELELYVYTDDNATLISDKAVMYGSPSSAGTYLKNWPIISPKAERIVYMQYISDFSMPDLYLYDVNSNENSLLVYAAAQVFTNEEVTKCFVNGNIKTDESAEEFTGTLYDVNLMTLEKEEIVDKIWALYNTNVKGIMVDGFFDNYIYYKDYEYEGDTANLYYINENNEEELLLSSISVIETDHSDDYSIIYGLEYYYELDGGELFKIAIMKDGTTEKTSYSNFVSSFEIDDKGEKLAYLVSEKLYLVLPDETKKMVTKIGIDSYAITDNGERLYFFKESSEWGKGEMLIMSTDGTEDFVNIPDITTCWDFGDGNIAFFNNVNVETYSGSFWITDGYNYELIGDNASYQINLNKLR